jgi:hypothetical protein
MKLANFSLSNSRNFLALGLLSFSLHAEKVYSLLSGNLQQTPIIKLPTDATIVNASNFASLEELVADLTEKKSPLFIKVEGTENVYEMTRNTSIVSNSDLSLGNIVILRGKNYMRIRAKSIRFESADLSAYADPKAKSKLPLKEPIKALPGKNGSSLIEIPATCPDGASGDSAGALIIVSDGKITGSLVTNSRGEDACNGSPGNHGGDGTDGLPGENKSSESIKKSAPWSKIGKVKMQSGKDELFTMADLPSLCGKPGGPAGLPGPAGCGGNGGNGAIIQIESKTNEYNFTINYDVTGGNLGIASDKIGLPGKPGKGGEGGTFTDTSRTTKQAPKGVDGNSVDDPLHPDAVEYKQIMSGKRSYNGKAGSDGDIRVVVDLEKDENAVDLAATGITVKKVTFDSRAMPIKEAAIPPKKAFATERAPVAPTEIAPEANKKIEVAEDPDEPKKN